MEPSLFGILALVISIAGYVPYIKTVLSGRSRPTISAWISCGLMDGAIFAGMAASGIISGQMLAYVIGCILVVYASMRTGTKLAWTWLDYTCISMVALTIGIWSVTGDPNWAIIISLVALTIGGIPMYVNLLREPARESIIPWIMWLVGGMCGVLAINEWTVAEALAPTAIFAMQTIPITLIARKFRTSQAV